MLNKCSALVLLSIFISFFSYAKPLPVESFANLPDVRNVSLSPGGTKLSAIVRVDYGKTKGVGIEVTDLKSGKKELLLFSDNTKYFLGNVWWKDDTTLLMKTWYPADRDTWMGYYQQRHKSREVRLMIINTDTGEITSPLKKTFLKKYQILPSGLGGVVSSLYKDPDHILMSIPSMNRGYPSYPMVIKVNIKNQRKNTIQKPDVKVFGWSTDQNDTIRYSYHYKDGRITHRIKDHKTGKWKDYWPSDAFSKDEVDFLGFGNNPNVAYISAYQDNFKALFKVDLLDKKLKRELVYANPDYDVDGYLIHSKKDGRLLGIGSGSDEGTHFIDPAFKGLQEKINKALPDTRNHIYSITADEDHFMVYSTGAKESGTYYMGTRSPVGLKAVSYRYEKLPPDTLSDVKRIEYKTRDGVDIEAFLTLPKGVPAKNLPTLMFPHGGPMARDALAFDYWAQFFANRGYAVLQMNFRGSTGLGFEHRNSGLKKWGKEMQDDVEDGALDLIKKGITDSSRICIVGASYGGYAALMGVAKTPDRYQCAISVNGVSNVFDLVKDNRSLRASFNIVDEMIGKKHKNLRDISPVNHAKKIKAPVLLVHGTLDRQVDIKHSHQMRDAMKAENKDVTFIEMEGEDHYLTREAMRVKAFKAMEVFLAEHLPVTQ